MAPQTACLLVPSTSGLAGSSLLNVSRRNGYRRSVAVRAAAGPEQLSQVASAVAHVSSSVPSALDHLAAALTPYLLTLGDITDGATIAAGDMVQAVADAAPDAAVAPDNSGVFGFLATAFEAFLKVLDNGLVKLGVPYSYGFAIILLTVLVKAATYPLSKKQVESTISMQALQPRVKDLQAKYQKDPERLQSETARLYKEAGVNPLAGCLPTLATIPVWIGLYKALSNVANEGLLTEGFFWIPSLGGPATLAAQQAGGGLSWLFPFVNGAPPIGWYDAAAYLVLPVLLVVSQSISQQIMSPSTGKEDPAQQQTQAILKFLPLMIGWFSLNVPSGLTLYWFTNNLLTTAQTVFLRSTTTAAAAAADGGTVVLPPMEPEEPKRPTGKDINARRSKKQLESTGFDSPQASGSGKGEKFRQIKAREAARKAAKLAGAAQEQGGQHAAAEAVQVEQTLKVPDAAPAKDNGSAVEASKSE